MINRVTNKWPFALLSFFILLTASLPFLNVYNLVSENILVFIGMLALVCLMTLLIQNQFIIFPLYVFSYFFTLYCYFPFNRRFGFTWVGIFIQKLLQTYPKMLNGELNYLPDFFALPLILFLLISLSILSIRYERWMLGYMMLVSYLLMLAVFNQLNLSIQVLLITSFALLFYVLKQVPKGLISNGKRRLVLLNGFMLLSSIGCAYFLPISFPKLQNFLLAQTTTVRSYVNQQGVYQKIESYGSNNASKTGFSDNDEVLGGPISDDQTILFTAKQASEHYWRVETKNYYTGKGWTSTSEIGTASGDQALVLSTNPEYQGDFDAATLITLTFNGSKDYLPYPYGNSSIPFTSIGRTEQIQEKQRIKLFDQPKTISFSWEKPAFTQETLQQVPYQISQDEQMTQVPLNTSKRVKELALSLTQSQETLYDKVKAVEQYLKQDGTYRYSKVDTPFTPPNEDYINYFLFESKIGYCDNFSSAMTIMLRSIGIPSRWVKGFSSGEVTDNKEAEYKEYTIKNSDAHSWPEVYFEGYGWIPFEPTPSFTNEVTQEATTNNSVAVSELTSASTEATDTTQTQQTDTTSSLTENSTKKEKQDSLFSQWFPLLRNFSLGLIFILLIICSFFLKKYFFLVLFRLYLAIHPKRFVTTYTMLLRKAEKRLPRQANEPLTNFAKRFEEKYSEFDGRFIQLTELYEQMLYGGNNLNVADYGGLLLQIAKLLTNTKKNKTE